MARHGENIRKRKDGRWEGRYLIYSEEKQRKVYHSVYSRTYEETKKKLTMKKISLIEAESSVSGETEEKTEGKAEREAEEKTEKEMKNTEEKMENADSYSKERPVFHKYTFAKGASEWLKEVKKARKPSTYVKYSLIYRIHVEPLLHNEDFFSAAGNIRLLEKISDHLSESIRKSIYCVLNQILKFISRQYGLTMPAINKPAFSGRNKPVEVLTRNEQSRLISLLSQGTDKIKAAVLLCLHTGLRLGELCALKWKDIDFDQKLISVSRTVQRLYADGRQTKTVLLETAPKSEYSRREIPLTDRISRLLEKIQNNSEYVFGKDKPMKPRTMQNHLKKLMNMAGIKCKNFHILRHTFATNCIEGGADVKSLSELLGHSNVQISLNRYVHPSMDSKRKHMDGLALYYGQICR